jgi:hypothetical protein
VSLQLFTTIATLGTPQDVTVQELRIESFFPMGADTETLLRLVTKLRATAFGASSSSAAKWLIAPGL